MHELDFSDTSAGRDSAALDQASTLQTQLTLSIVSHGHGAWLARLLHQLNTRPALAGTQVIVTLNVDGEVFDPSAYPALHIVSIRNRLPRGFGANHNAAFALCRTPWFAILNPDLALDGDEPFDELIRSAQAFPRVGLIAPRVVAPTGTGEDSVRENLTPWSLIRRRLFGRRASLEVHQPARRGSAFFWVAGMCMVVSSEAFRGVGGFDERFFLYCEDYDLCARLYNRGYAIVFEPRARIVHAAQRDSHRSIRHLRWHLSSIAKVWLSSSFWRVTLARTA